MGLRSSRHVALTRHYLRADLSLSRTLLFLLALVGLRARHVELIDWLALVGFTIGYLRTARGSVLSIVPSSFWYGYLVQIGWVLLPLSGLPWLFTGLMTISISFVRMEILRGYGILLLVMGLLGWAYYFTDSTADTFGARSDHIAFGCCSAWVG